MRIIDHQRIDGVIPNARGQRPFPTTSLSHFDPFVMLDHIGPATMPSGWKLDGGTDNRPHLHPHRGFETITFMFEGNMRHRDSKFTERPLLTNGSVQQMNAGSGIRHGGDMWADDNQQFNEIQLWVNSPAKYKMSEPSVHNVGDNEISAIIKKSKNGAANLRIVAGTLNDITGPIKTFANIRVIHGKVTNSHDIKLSKSQLENTHNRTMLYILSGSATIQGTRVNQFQGAAFEEPLSELSFIMDDGGEFLLMSGQSIDEPIVYGGPFIMNTADEIEQAYQDASQGIF